MADCCRIPPKMLRHIGRLQTDAGAGTFDTLGQETHDWTTEATIHCMVKPLSGSELEIARQLYAQAAYEVVCRYRAGITTRHRWNFNGRILNIGYVDDFDTRSDVTMLCKEDAPTS